jgi:hypothetical protein
MYKTSPGHLAFCLLFILPLKAFWWSFWIGMKIGHTCIIYFAKSKTGFKEMQVIHFDENVQACGIFIIFLIPKYFFVLL